MREGIPRPEVWAMPRIDASASCDCSSARDAGPACRPPAPDAGERLTRTRKSCCTWMPWACRKSLHAWYTFCIKTASSRCNGSRMVCRSARGNPALTQLSTMVSATVSGRRMSEAGISTPSSTWMRSRKDSKLPLTCSITVRAIREARILFSTTLSSTSSKDRSKSCLPDGVASGAPARAARQAPVTPRNQPPLLCWYICQASRQFCMSRCVPVWDIKAVRNSISALSMPGRPAHKPSTIRSRTCLASLRWGWMGAVGVCIT